MSTYVYLNGNLAPSDQAAVSVFDAGFLHGASTFTTMYAHNGKVFRLDRHLARLMDTVKTLELRTDATEASLTQAVYRLLRANGMSRFVPPKGSTGGTAAEFAAVAEMPEELPPVDEFLTDAPAGDDAGKPLGDARMRLTITPGSVHGGVPTTLVTAEPLPPYPAAWYEKGVTVIVSSFKESPADPIFGNKTGCYLPRILARQEAAHKGAEEALWFTTENHLAEACFNNVFLVFKGTVYTPPRDTPVLPGIVREAVLELCSQLDIPSNDQMPLTVKEMLLADEVFLTGSTTGIRPVARIERHAVAEEKPGPITRRLMDAYRELVERETK